MSRFKAAVFDLDGTLCNTLDDLRDAVNAGLREVNLPEIAMDDFIFCVGSGAHYMLRSAIKKVGGDEAVFPTVLERFAKEYAVNYNVKTAPYDGMVEMVQHLKDAGIKLAVITNKPDARAKNIVTERFGDLFDFVIGSEVGYPLKPEKEITLHVLDVLGVTQEQAVFVGDSDVDVKTAINADVYGIAVGWGYRDKPCQIAAGATHFADSVEQLEAMILGEE